MASFHSSASVVASLFVFSVSTLGTATSAEEQLLVLVANGTSRAPIVLAEDATPFTRQAAEELASCIEKASGARPKVVKGWPDPVPKHAVWVGFQPGVAELFPEIDFEFEHPEEILITASADHLVIAGRDRWDPDHLVARVADEEIVGRQREYGTVNAVYTFIQKRLGVRWLWPGELGEDVVRRKTLAFAPFVDRFHPPIRSRGGLFNFSSLGNRGYGRSHQWTRRQRLQLNSLNQPGGHAFTDWWERFQEEHRDYFALQPDGERSGFPNPRTVKLCQSNPAVWKQWLADVETRIEQDPNQLVFNGSPNDGWFSGHCVCENCRAWDHPNGVPRTLHWKRGSKPYVALSDRHVTFANHLARLLERRYPKEDRYVLMLGYGHSRPAPVEAVPADNVIIASVANFLGRRELKDRGSTRGTTHREQFAAWGKVAPHLMWRPNTGSPAGWQQGLPDLSTTETIEDLKFVTENGGIGIYVDSVWEHWATQGPQYYVMAQLVWDPTCDAEAILDDFYQRGFGPAAADVRGYFTLLEDARKAFLKEHGYGAGVFEFPKLYTEELLARADERLGRARALVADGPDNLRERVEFVRAGFAYSKQLVETIRLMRVYWSEPAPAVAEQVKANWTRMERIAKDHPFAINWGPLRPQTPRMAGLHPDHPHPKWKPQDRDLD